MMSHAGLTSLIAMAALAAGCVGETGNDDTKGEAHAAECSCYRVDRVEYQDALLGVRTKFNVIGAGLPQTIAFWVDQCRDVRRESWSESLVTFSCVPDWTEGRKSGVVKPYSGAPTQFRFEVEVNNPD